MASKLSSSHVKRSCVVMRLNVLTKLVCRVGNPDPETAHSDTNATGLAYRVPVCFLCDENACIRQGSGEQGGYISCRPDDPRFGIRMDSLLCEKPITNLGQ